MTVAALFVARACRWHLHLPIDARSQNQLHSKGGGRWAYRAHAKAIVAALGIARHIPRAAIKRRVTLTRIWGKRQRAFDRGNLIGGLKPVLDGLRDVGLIVDDSAKWCEDHYSQRGPEAQSGIGITIEELE